MAKRPKDGNGQAAADTTSNTLTIQGIKVTIPVPYTEGYTLNADEARELNRIVGENIRNNSRARAKKAQAKWEKAGNQGPLDGEALDKLRSEILAYAENYKIRGRRARVHLDPIEKIARSLAKEALLVQMRKKGFKSTKLEATWVDKMITQLLDTKPFYREEAQRRVAACEEAVAGILKLVDIESGGAQPAMD